MFLRIYSEATGNTLDNDHKKYSLPVADYIFCGCCQGEYCVRSPCAFTDFGVWQILIHFFGTCRDAIEIEIDWIFDEGLGIILFHPPLF